LANEKILDECNSPTFLADITRIEASLDQQNLYNRIIKQILKRRIHAVEIVDFAPENSTALLELIPEWLAQKQENSNTIKSLVCDPIVSIVNKQGAVLLVRLDGYFLGACILQKLNGNQYEISMFFVRKSVTGYGFRKLLIRSALDRVRELGGNSVSIIVNKSNSALLSFLFNVSFEHVENSTCNNSRYSKNSVLLETDLQT